MEQEETRWAEPDDFNPDVASDAGYADENMGGYAPIVKQADYGDEGGGKQNDMGELVNLLKQALPMQRPQRPVTFGNRQISDEEAAEFWREGEQYAEPQNGQKGTDVDRLIGGLEDLVGRSQETGKNAQNIDPYEQSFMQNNILPSFETYQLLMEKASNAGSAAQDKFGYDTMRTALLNMYRLIGSNNQGMANQILSSAVPALIDDKLKMRDTKQQTQTAYSEFSRQLPASLRGANQLDVIRPIYNDALRIARGDFVKAAAMSIAKIKTAFPAAFSGMRQTDYAAPSAGKPQYKNELEFVSWLDRTGQ